MTADGVAVMIVVWNEQPLILSPLTTDATILQRALHRLENDAALLRGMHMAARRREVGRRFDPQLWSLTERVRYRGVLNTMLALTQTIPDASIKKSLLYVGRGFATRPPEKRDDDTESSESSAIGEASDRGEAPRRDPLTQPPPGDHRPEIGRAFNDRWLAAASATEAVGKIANRTKLTVYGLYGGGLEDGLPCDGCRMMLAPGVADGVSSLNIMASTTGGVATGTSNVTDRTLTQIHRDMTSYYTLAYRTHSHGKGAVRKLEVNLRDGVRGPVRHRRQVILEPVTLP